MSSLCLGSQSFRCMSMFVPIEALFSMDSLGMQRLFCADVGRYQMNVRRYVCYDTRLQYRESAVNWYKEGK